MIDSPYLVTPGKKLKLSHIAPGDTGHFKHKDDAENSTQKSLDRLAEFQEKLFAESKQSLLVILQAMDCGGKDGTIRKVFTGVNPQGCTVTGFRAPSTLERSHDFLWRHHLACPRKGMIGIHNRSHYESVLVERVHEIVPKKVWEDRFAQINQFEAMLTAEGTTIVKFFLHISKDEQKERLQDRIDHKEKHWKFDINDLAERKRWDEYQRAYDDVLERCSTNYAPWYIVPADHKWFRNHVVADVLARTMEKMNPQVPEEEADFSNMVIE
jgi:PPK2 family polyphosphate:nucleotide phosphotransferase